MIKRDNNPFNGRHSAGYRFRFHVRAISHRALFLPLDMRDIPEIRRLIAGESPLSVFNKPTVETARKAFNELRKKFDFTYWAATEYLVRDINDADRTVTLILNSYQHHIIDTFLKRYFDCRKSRYIITKSFRSCGVTTCVQAYILWLQIYRCQKHSNTCGASEFNVHPLKTNLLRYLKRDVMSPEKSIYIPEADRCAFYNSYRTPDALRGIDFGYVHLADMSKWNDPGQVNSSRAYVAASGGVLLNHRTLIIMEGNIPQEKYFRLQDNFNPRHPRALRLQDYPGICRNPFFLREVLDAANPLCHSLFIHIDLDALFTPRHP